MLPQSAVGGIDGRSVLAFTGKIINGKNISVKFTFFLLKIRVSTPLVQQAKVVFLGRKQPLRVLGATEISLGWDFGLAIAIRIYTSSWTVLVDFFASKTASETVLVIF